MKTRCLMLVAGLLLLPTAGCLWSLHPLHTEQDQILEPGLVGVWAASDGEVIAIVRQAEDKSYQITYLEKDSSEEAPARYRGRLLRLGDFVFLDLAAEPDVGRREPNGMVATHLFFRIRLSGDELQVEMVDDELLQEADAAQLRREKLPDRYVTLLTASSKEVRTWLEQHAGNPKLYSDTLELRRVK